MSRIDLAPAQTTATGVRESSTRSAEMSKVSSAPRCTPPMPPVAKISMPASPAINIVAATVVPAEPLRAATSARSRREAFTTPPLSWPSRSISSLERPTLETAIDDRDRRRNGAHFAHRRLNGLRGLDVARVGHAMGDDRRFERDDRPLGRARLGDLGGKVQKIGGVHRSSLPSRTAAISRAGFIGNLNSMFNGAPCPDTARRTAKLAIRRIRATFTPKARPKMRVDGRQAS